MKEYKCDICNKVFKYKNDYTRHQNRKNKCIPKVSLKVSYNIIKKDKNDTNNNNNISQIKMKEDKKDACCKYCGKVFTFKNNLYRHLSQTCKIKEKMAKEKEEIFNSLIKKMEELEKSNKEIKEKNKKLEYELKKITNKKIKHINNTQNNMTNCSNVVSGNTFMLVGYGKEDMTKIDKNDIIKSLKGFHTPLKLTDTVHFNSKYPEYHNIYISNMKDKYAMIYDCNKWSLTTRTELIDKLYENNRSYVEDNLDEFCEKLTPSLQRSLKRWLDIDEEDPKVKAIKEDIKLLLYNKRDIPMQTKELNMIDEN